MAKKDKRGDGGPSPHDRLCILMALRYAANSEDDLVETFQNELDGDVQDGVCRVEVGEEVAMLAAPATGTFTRLAESLEKQLVKEGAATPPP